MNARKGTAMTVMSSAIPIGGRYESIDETEVSSGAAGAIRIPTSKPFQQQRRNLVYSGVRLRQVPTHLHSDFEN